MRKLNLLKLALASEAATLALAASAQANEFNIPNGDLKHALDAYMKQAGVPLMYPEDEMRGVVTRGAKGELSTAEALARILRGTGFSATQDATGIIGIVKDAPARPRSELAPVTSVRLASTDRAAASVETVVVTSSKIKGDIQTVPIAITALSQEQLASRQIAGGPDLVKEVPNLTFSKTNFTGYNIEIRGIGTQAISVTTDPAVAVAFNDMPFIRNHFFEQEFYDVSQVEVLRGPQGTLYGRNATAGVVNVISAKPSDQFEAMLSADWGNYSNRRYEAMVNLPVVDDRLDLRFAAEWTKRDGYSFNSETNSPIDGRDLWSSRFTIGFHPTPKLQAYLVWEHFQEDDDRLRSSKQLCKRDSGLANVLGVSTATGPDGQFGAEYLSQGCLPTSLYSKDAYEVPNSLALAYYGALIGAGFGLSIQTPLDLPGPHRDAYASTTQSTNLRVIESSLNPIYKAKNDTLELNADYNVTPSLTLTSQTGFNHDFLYSAEDFNRFNTQPGVFAYNVGGGDYQHLISATDGNYVCSDGTFSPGANNCANPSTAVATGYFCDPQLGCSDRLVVEDLSDEHAWQLNQEFRLASNFTGPFNFSVGGNYMHYETEENYYVFANTLTMYSAIRLGSGLGSSAPQWNPSDESQQCVKSFENPSLIKPGSVGNLVCIGWIDHNPLSSLDNQGHNYFLSQNPYNLNSYAGFGEAYYQVLDDLKLTTGLRWTDDKKRFIDIPSQLFTFGYGYPVTGIVNQEWREWTGRGVADWTPKLSFTDQTLVYASYSRGYKGGGANPPGAFFAPYQPSSVVQVTHPLTFKPEFINAYELGTKNALLDGALTLNGDVFYYDYKDYQISEIVDRTALNLNFDATVKGAELEASYEPLPGLKFNLTGGYEKTRMANGSQAIDLMDRTAGHAGWIVMKPFPDQASNCVLPAYILAYQLSAGLPNVNYAPPEDCEYAYSQDTDPVTGLPYTSTPANNRNGVQAGGAPGKGKAIVPGSYDGFDPLAGNDPGDPYTGQNTANGIDYGPAPNGGAGFTKDLSGNELPNAPHFTTSFSAEYTMPVSENWAATLHGDFYWQSQSWARIFNDVPYDKLRGYSNVNLALILTSGSGWQVMGYVKNIFDTTAITGDFLNSDDTGLTTNVFLTDPRLYGVRVTKNW